MSDVEKFDHPYDLFDHLEIAMARPIFFPATPAQHGGRYMQFGSGLKHIKGWLNWDWEDWDAESGEEIPRDSGSVDGIVCYHTMDHLSEPIRVLAEFQRILRVGGWLVIVVPHYDSELWHSDLTHKSQFGTETWRSVFSERHYQHNGVVSGHIDWALSIEYNAIFGLTERNTVLVTQFRKSR